MKTNRKQLLIVYICLALGAWSASAGISFSQSNRDTNQTRRDNTIIQHKSEKTVDDSDQGSPVIASYYKDGKKKKKTEDGVPLLPDVGGKSDPGASWTEVGPELRE